jgi:hypothetical protein
MRQRMRNLVAAVEAVTGLSRLWHLNEPLPVAGSTT